MTKRSSWCEFDKETRKYIKKRDKERCIYCGYKGALQIAHIFLSRAHGGRGTKENGVLLCVTHHQILDNYFSNQESEKDNILNYCENYLIDKENLKSRFKGKKELIDYLKFDKEKYLQEIEQKQQKQVIEKQKEETRPITPQHINRCKDCIYLVKDKRYNSSIPNYFCKYKKMMRLNKTTKACKKFRRKYEK